MSPNKRIFLNIVATYGRSLFSLVCGLFGSRWVLMALGQEDFGLYGVVGGLVVFIGLINMLLGAAVSRFYAVSVGAATTAKNKTLALNECRAWFSTAVLIHTILPFVLMAIGEPIGEYAIRSGWLTVPPDRIKTCLWVFRFSCVASFVGMLSVPFNAMYTAKQYIAELTIYGIASSVANVGFFYYMASHPSVWLDKYAAWMACVSILPSIIIAIRACFIFPECRLIVSEMLNWQRLWQLMSYAGWQAFGTFGWFARTQGTTLLLNQHTEFGLSRNASMTIANQIAAQTETLSSAMIGAFQPAIAQAYGAKDIDQMRTLAFRASKFGTLLSAIFILPLILELPTVLKIWLKKPPEYTQELAYFMLIGHLLDRMTSGHLLAINATGKIAHAQAAFGSILILCVPIAVTFISLECGIFSVGLAFVVTVLMCMAARVWFARSIVGMAGCHWLYQLLLPLIALFLLTFGIGCLPRLIMQNGLWRIGVTTALCEISLTGLSWFFLLDVVEHDFIKHKCLQFNMNLKKKLNWKIG